MLDDVSKPAKSLSAVLEAVTQLTLIEPRINYDPDAGEFAVALLLNLRFHYVISPWRTIYATLSINKVQLRYIIILVTKQ